MATKKKPGARPTTVKRTGADKPLTAKQEQMVHEYLLRGNKAKAYQKAFDTQAQGQNLYVVAWKEFEKPHIKRHVQDLQDKAVFTHLVTKETLAREFDEARDMGLTLGHTAAVVSASTAKAKLYGQLVDKVQQEVSGPNGQPIITAPIRIEVIHVKHK